MTMKTGLDSSVPDHFCGLRIYEASNSRYPCTWKYLHPVNPFVQAHLSLEISPHYNRLGVEHHKMKKSTFRSISMLDTYRKCVVIF